MGAISWDEPGDEGGTSLNGTVVFDLNGNPLGIFHAGGQGYGAFIDQLNGNVIPIPQGGMVLTNRLGQAFDISGDGTVSAQRTIPQGGLGGGGGSAPAYSSTSAAQEDAQAHDMARLEREHQLALEQGRESDARRLEQEMALLRERIAFEREEGRLGRENQLSLGLLDQFGSMAQTFAQMRQQARQLYVETQGRDPFRAAALESGMSQVGTTPTEGFRSDLAQFAQQPVLNFNARAPLNQQQFLVNAQAQQIAGGIPQAPALGMEMGGTVRPAPNMALPSPDPAWSGPPPTGAPNGMIDMQPGAGGMYEMAQGAQQGGVGYGVLVGEEKGGRVDASSEVMHVKPDGTIEVIPLVAGAAEGGTFDSQMGYAPQTGFDITPTRTGMLGGLAPLYGALGMSDIPLAQRSSEGGYLNMGTGFYGQAGQLPTFDPSRGAETLRGLGIRPRLIRDATTGAIYSVNQAGQLEHIQNMGAFNSAQLRMSDVVNLMPGEIGEMGYNQAGAGQFAGQNIVQPNQPFAPLSAPIIEPMTGALLPAPEELASVFRFLSPSVQSLYLSAAEFAGLGGETIQSRMAQFSPTGSAQRVGALR